MNSKSKLPSSKNVLDLRTARSQRPVRTSADINHSAKRRVSIKTRLGSTRRSRANARSSGFSVHQVGSILYEAISGFGWLLMSLCKLVRLSLRGVALILLSPIKLLDMLLDGLKLGLARLPKLLRQGFLKLIKSLALGAQVTGEFIKRYEAKPTVLWGRALVVFVGLGLLLTIPIKLYGPLSRAVSTSSEVLGASTDALKLLGLAGSLREYTPAALVASKILGFERPTRWLVVSQNNHELRGTGGFLGFYMLVNFDQGEIKQVESPGGGFYDLRAGQTRYIAPPRPFRIFADSWNIWDANWHADFPTAAQTLMRLYDEHGGPTVDGVIAMTPNLVKDLLRLTGPITLPEYDQVIEAENFVYETQLEVEIEYDRVENTPKAFLADFASLFLGEILKTAQAGKIQELLAALDRAFAERHLLIYMNDESGQRALAELGWTGEIRKVPGDYLQVVHNNTGGGKTDLVIKNSISDDIELTERGTAIHHVRLTRSHGGDLDGLFTGHDNLDYVRFYTPLGSRLISATGFTEEPSERFELTERELEIDPSMVRSEETWVVDIDSGTHIFEETGRIVFGNWLSLKPGQTKTVEIVYEVPLLALLAKGGSLLAGVSERTGGSAVSDYVMYYQKQSGSQGAKLDVSIGMAPSYQVASVHPASPHVSRSIDESIKYRNDLRVDRWLRVEFE